MSKLCKDPAIVDDVVAEEQAQTLLQVLNLVRSGSAVTRPDLVRSSELGRAVITQRLEQLIALDLIVEGDVLAVPRGRSPRGLQFNKLRGYVLAADIGAQGMFVGLADLAGGILERVYLPNDISVGPEETLKTVIAEFDKILHNRQRFEVHLWGIGISIPGPVEFATGRAISPPIMPGWNEFDIRDMLQERYSVPVWIDNDVNVMALGELRAGAAVDHSDIVVVKISTGIGAGLVSNGVLHRGAQGSAGDIGHVKVSDDPSIQCRCGNTGCLEALASGWALAQRGAELAARGESPFLAERAEHHPLAAADVVAGAVSGDRASVVLMTESARLVGDTLARIVNFFNPSLILLGGRLMLAGDAYLATVRNIVYSRSLPLATRELVIAKVALGERAALHGATALALDEIFRPAYFAEWAGENRVPAVLQTESREPRVNEG
jgi:glucokinase-like ROK family protein